jgi:hypothetical protein
LPQLKPLVTKPAVFLCPFRAVHAKKAGKLAIFLKFPSTSSSLELMRKNEAKHLNIWE